MDELFLPAIVFLSALIFYATSLQKECLYRRYILPGMLIALALVSYNNYFAAVLFFISAILVYYGFRGYGRKIIEEGKEEVKEK